MKNFVGKMVYITGGSAGIGLSTAKLLAASGADIIIFARTGEKLVTALHEIEKQRITPAQRFAYRQLDAADHTMVNTVLTEAVQDFGAPDLLINCAGRALPHYFEDITYAQFDESMKINLYSIWNTVSVLVPSMKRRGGGAIVNVSSMCGFMGVFGYTDYCASKFGIIGLSEALKQELQSQNITVAVLCPPDTDTPGFAIENVSKPLETKALSAGAKIMQPDEVARELIEGIRRGTFMIIPGTDGKLTYFMKRHFPALVELIMRRGIRKAQKGKT
jgi:3-dehydrosphinganine reductase